jgi:phage shock protein PspC (stress-responsive transcriptional regulator)
MILCVRKLSTLPLYGITFACEGLSFDYNWDCTIIFGVRVVENVVTGMSIADIFCHLTFAFHMGTSDSDNIAVITTLR